MSDVSPCIFKNYDIRGVVKTDLTPDTVQRIGHAFASEALLKGNKTVVIARDGRLSSALLIMSLAKGLQAGGCDVIDIGMVPTPVLYFATHYFETGTGIMVTGSHNPPEYNGLKMLISGTTLYGEDIQKLRKLIESNELCLGKGKYKFENILDKYREKIIGNIKLDKKFNIAIDCGNGVAGVIAAQLFRDLGCDVTELYCEVNGEFPNHHPDPSKLENLKDICKSIKDNQLDLGFAFDGDGDRIGVVDNGNNVILPDRQMILYAEDVLSRHPGAQIIYDIKSSHHLGDAIKKLGGEPLMWMSGHSLIKAKMAETGALLGGELSGHIFFKERWYGFDDGLYSAARMLEILSKKKGSAEQIFSALPDSYNTPELHVIFNEGEHYEFMNDFINQAEFPDANDICTIDGLRVSWNNGWGLIRASHTTPSLVLRFEADDKSGLDDIQNKFRQQILRINDSITLPF